MAIKWTFNPFESILEQVDVPNPTNYAGSDCTGESPDQDRTLTAINPRQVYLDGLRLQLTNQYTVSSGVITFLINVRDSQKIIVVN